MSHDQRGAAKSEPGRAEEIQHLLRTPASVFSRDDNSAINRFFSLDHHATLDLVRMTAVLDAHVMDQTGPLLLFAVDGTRGFDISPYWSRLAFRTGFQGLPEAAHAEAVRHLYLKFPEANPFRIFSVVWEPPPERVGLSATALIPQVPPGPATIPGTATIPGPVDDEDSISSSFSSEAAAASESEIKDLTNRHFRLAYEERWVPRSWFWCGGGLLRTAHRLSNPRVPRGRGSSRLV